MHSVRVIAAIVVLFAGSPALAQETVMRSEPTLDWKAAAEDKAQIDSRLIFQFRAGVGTNPDEIALPVLVPASGLVRGAPRLKGQTTAYAAGYPLRGAKMTVFGSATALTNIGDTALKEFAERNQGKRIFDYSPEGSDLSFPRYGASYLIRIVCDDALDSRCAERAFLDSVVDSLIPIGGRPQ